MKKHAFLMSLLLTLLLAAGCGSPAEQRSSAIPEKMRVDAALAQKAADTAKTVPGVRDATAVAVDGALLVGIKVAGFDRLRLKPTRNQVHAKAGRLGQGYDVQVTADKKLYAELREAAAQIEAGALAPALLQKEILKIRRDMQP
ncbi:MAG: YhcN/YlaJ family sporulation lipoprotein [Peptococcaceae bacterium]|jgi:hypothetical protein|nr:YhcN/YlaJ family sporulation lipoprotein [Peptococcaceae bacterium]